MKDDCTEIVTIGNRIYCKLSSWNCGTSRALTLQFRRFQVMWAGPSSLEFTGSRIGGKLSNSCHVAKVTLGLILAILVGCTKPSVSGHVYLTFGAGDVKPVAGQVVYLLPGGYDDLEVQVGSAFDMWATNYLIQQVQFSEDLEANDAKAMDPHRMGAVSKAKKLFILLDLRRASREATAISQELNNLPESIPEPVLKGRGSGLEALASDAGAVADFINATMDLQERRWDLTWRLLELPKYSGGEEAIERAFAERLVEATEARTDMSGAYSFTSVAPGRYVLMIGYATNLSEEGWWIEEISVSGPTTHDLTNFNLRPGRSFAQLREMAQSYLELKTPD